MSLKGMRQYPPGTAVSPSFWILSSWSGSDTSWPLLNSLESKVKLVQRITTNSFQCFDLYFLKDYWNIIRLEPFLSNNENSYVYSIVLQTIFHEYFKIINYCQFFFNSGLRPFGANMNGFYITISHFDICEKLSIIRCDN